MTADSDGVARRESHESDRVTSTFPAVPASAGAARTFVRSTLTILGADPNVVDDVELVVSELVSNAIEYAGGAEVTVEVDATDRRWWSLAVGCTTIADRRPPETDAWSIAGPNARSGRGLGIVHALMDEVLVEEIGGVATTVVSDRDRGQTHLLVRCRRRRTASEAPDVAAGT